MRLSKAHTNTLREVPVEAEIPSHILLIRSGMIRKLVSGIYGFMPLGLRTLRKIEDIVRREMDRAGAQEIVTSAVQPAELWQESGRWTQYGPELWRIKDRHDREFCLGPTAEEIFTDIVRSEITSHRQLPVNLYQFQTKYRDEARPRYGLMRCREFIMKDAYSFDRDWEGLDDSYLAMKKAYTNIFNECGLTFRPVAADSGAMGGRDSEEFVALCEYGENDIVYCDSCDMAATTEQAPGVDAAPGSEEEHGLQEVHTPGAKTIDEVAKFLGIPKEKTLKALLMAAYDDEGKLKEYVCAFLRGDRELNKVKLCNALGLADHQLEFADEDMIGPATGCVAGFTGPMGLHDCKIVADSEITGLKNLCAGACKKDFHVTGVNYGRDYAADIVVDLKLVGSGSPCPLCGAPLKQAKSIEVGQIFKLGTKYSESMGAMYLDENMESQPIIMGCYGIGVTRTMAAIVEQNHDEDGIIWPLAVAPYHAIITLVKPGDECQRKVAERIYSELTACGVETLLDDRDERPGVKFKDADLWGIPVRITVGKKAGDGLVEYRLRKGKTQEELSCEDAISKAKSAAAGG